MPLHHSKETHSKLVERIPRVTGRELHDWLATVEDGPSLSRFEEGVNWLRDEHGVPHGHATAIIHEHRRRRAARYFH